MPRKNKAAKRRASVVEVDSGSESSRFSLLTPATTPPQPKRKHCPRKADNKLDPDDDKEINSASESSSDEDSSAAIERIYYQKALAKETKARKAAEERLQDECKQLWAGMNRFLRHLENPPKHVPVDPYGPYPCAAFPPEPLHSPAHVGPTPDRLDTYGLSGGTSFEGQVGLDVAKGAFLNALTEAERKPKIPEPLPSAFPPAFPPYEIDTWSPPRKKPWVQSINMRTTREGLGMARNFCTVLVLLMAIAALSRLPGLMGGVTHVMEQQASGRRGFLGR